MADFADVLSHVTVNDYSFAYKKLGQGEPLILVHGHISDLRTFSALASILSASFTVYTYSRRYAWPNQAITSDAPQPWEQDASDLIALITALDLSPVHALGNSSGATVILLAARTHPHLFRTLLLEEPPVITLYLSALPPGPLEVLHFLASHPVAFWYVMYYGATCIAPCMELAKSDDTTPVDNAVLKYFGPRCLGTKHWQRAYADPQRKQQLHDNKAWLRNFMRYNSLPAFSPDDAHQIATPSLVITGKDGPYSQQCVNWELCRLLGSKMKREVIVQKAGHLMHEDNPEEVAKNVLDFINEAKWAH